MQKPHKFRGAWCGDFESRSYYSEGAGPYRIVPAAIAVPKDTEDIATLVTFARDRELELIPRGAGSGMPGGNVGDGIVVDMREFDRSPHFVSDRVLRCGVACTWADVDRAAQTEGLRLPPDPASKKFCTVGGMAANNAAGPRTVRFGSLRDWTMGVEMVTADGEIEFAHRAIPDPQTAAVARFVNDVDPEIRDAESLILGRFPKTSKNSSGYALDRYLRSGRIVDLLVGSEGTLGIFTQVDLMLDASPTLRGSALALVHEPGKLVPAIEAARVAEPSAIELLDETFLQLARDNTDLDLSGATAVLLIDVESDTESELADRLNSVQEAMSGLASRVLTALTEEDAAALWEIRHAASPTLARLPDNRRSMQIIEDSCVPLNHLDEYLREAKRSASENGIDIVAFGHAGDGHVHINAIIDVNAPDLATRLNRLLTEMTEMVARLGGTMSGEHGDGRLRAAGLERIYGPEIMRLFERVKNAFDPLGILNPGVIVPRFDPVASLKVGGGSPSIGNEAAEFLRQLERDALWGTLPPILHNRT